MDQADWNLVKAAPLFDGVPDEAVMRLIGNHAPREYDKGTVIFRQGESADAFYFILEGWVKLYKSTDAGDEAVLQMLSAAWIMKGS